jgi:hypothetical protein
MAEMESKTPLCPRCGSGKVIPCAQSIEYGPEKYCEQPLVEREVKTLAYQGECGLGFTRLAQPPDSSGN